MPAYLISNPAIGPASARAQAANSVLNPDHAAAALAELRAWPVYAATPLVRLDGLARRLGLAELLVKDEGRRQPLESFKALGGAYALGEALRDRIETATGRRPGYAELWDGRHSRFARSLHVIAATDGNHGRSVAWGASLFGCPCTIYLPDIVSDARADAIAAFGAEIVRIPGNYDHCFEHVVALAGSTDRLILQDTTHPALDTLATQRIMHGYTLLSQEVREELQGPPPTHIFLQVGCGGMAAAVAADIAWNYEQQPRIILVEPMSADCMLRSIAAQTPTVVGGAHETIMIGLACGEISSLAWPILSASTDFAVSIGDSPAREIMRLCAQGVDGDPSMVIGETGGAGLAALLELSRDPAQAAAIGLGPDARVLTINTEGAIDKARYDEIVATAEAA